MQKKSGRRNSYTTYKNLGRNSDYTIFRSHLWNVDEILQLQFTLYILF